MNTPLLASGSRAFERIVFIHAIDPLPADCVSAVLDLGHTGLEGEGEAIAIDIAWSRLSMINLKNAVRFADGKDAHGATNWNRTWVPGREGFTSWGKAISELGRRRFDMPICLTAEYKDRVGRPLTGDAVITPLMEDLSFLKELVQVYYNPTNQNI